MNAVLSFPSSESRQISEPSPATMEKGQRRSSKWQGGGHSSAGGEVSRMLWLFVHCFQEVLFHMEPAVVAELSWRALNARCMESEAQILAR